VGLTRETPIGVLGAGAMGGGIAQVAATAGHPVVLADLSEAQVTAALESLRKALDRDVEKGRRTAGDAAAALARIQPASVDGQYGVFSRCGLVIEAVIEDLKVKRQVFQALEAVTDAEAVLATNTSSLSVTAIAATCTHPERVLGIHFFNPAPVMPLVEIVGGHGTDAGIVTAVRSLVDGWGKTTVRASDTPGFIVNRVARPFYGEAIRIAEEGIADYATIDWTMRDLGGFRMGPFELMDLIGNDVNHAVTRSVFEAFAYEPRYRPSLTQQRLVEARLYGRKSGRGYYDYREGAVRPEPLRDEALGRRIVDRILAMLINEAVDAVFWRVATPDDIDLAMTKGVHYPKGLLRWGDEIGLARVYQQMLALQEEYGEDRYRPSPLLRRMVREGARFFA
jgi:3-hydroxybutyryl-CoA dehydrogenase